MIGESSNIVCRCCKSKIETEAFKGNLIGHQVSFFECNYCSYVQTEKPYWLNEAYESPINKSDTGILARNFKNLKKVIVVLNLLNSKNGKVLDFAGGYGFLTRLLRDQGVDAFWYDPYTENLTAKGFEYNYDFKPDLVTAFEAFEHFENPIEKLDEIFSICDNLLFSTDIIPKPTPNFESWSYYGSDHGQHIGFFRKKTLEYIALKYNKNLLTNDKDLHLLTSKKIVKPLWLFNLILGKYFFSSQTLGLKSKTILDNEKIREEKIYLH